MENGFRSKPTCGTEVQSNAFSFFGSIYQKYDKFEPDFELKNHFARISRPLYVNPGLSLQYSETCLNLTLLKKRTEQKASFILHRHMGSCVINMVHLANSCTVLMHATLLLWGTPTPSLQPPEHFRHSLEMPNEGICPWFGSSSVRTWFDFFLHRCRTPELLPPVTLGIEDTFPYLLY